MTIKNTVTSHIRLNTILCLLCFFPHQAWSEDYKTVQVGENIHTTNPCAPQLIAKPQKITAKDPKQTNPPQHIEADSLLQPSKNEYLLQGHANLNQPGLVVLSDEAVLNKQTQTAVFNGHVELHQPELIITADNARVNNRQETAVLNNTRYQILPSRTHGKSKNIQIDQKAQQAALARASLTTCKLNSDQSVDWDLKFDELTIDNKTRRVVGKNTTLYFKDIPIFYTPYFDYPLDDRASGLLFPEIGSYKSLTQNESNQYVKMPYYFNIAANMDDTLTAIPMTQRGLALENEFRYIARNNDITHGAKITLTGLQDNLTASEGIVSSDLDGNLIYGDKRSERWRASIEANQNWGYGFSSTLNWDEVSDESFFADIPVQNNLKTATQKQRNAQINYKDNAFSAYIQLLSYLRLQNAAINYEKRPEIGASYAKYLGNFDFEIAATVTDFVTPVAVTNKYEAVRFHTAPTLSYQIQNSYAHLKTTLVANQTQYNMRDDGFNEPNQNTITRFIPQMAVRGGLIFERDFEFNKQNYIQTLEPEVQYLYTPYEDQSNITLFDTADRSLDFSNLFALNRFTGADRIGDTRQVSAALTSKLLSPQGRPIAEAGVGQIAYLEDRRVTLSNIPETDKVSDIFVKLGLNFNEWYFASTTQLDSHDQHLTNANTRLKWQRNDDLALLNHTLNNQGTAFETEMLSFGGYTKINSKWDLGIYSSYDLREEDFYEMQLGLRYDSCCWAAEFIAERTQLENGLYNDGIQVQFELKGLSSSGSKFKQALTEKLNF
ncbi:LPS-assembly protein LptD [Thiomicrorhabdus immobilis]|uniref:LPS-assembly protein LptD n=1 Tax=Thiomicrorhabdus immobilis TaxID=2791037 RepID=A0ABN6CYW7_9GAMM|nr:LPS assembly protein LptD [Thiomicrorhabdus immobilis]BCN92854.1 LPS-assembly protein LptD [Thiomicrorhabdus immobilis]